ncbi:MAG: biopolymer transporter ExbD [Pseudomonadota bacterium]
MLLDHARKPAIRVPLTPLIDVVFILLLFFMLSSVFGVEQHIALQQSKGRGGAQTAVTRVQLLVLPNGDIKGDAETWQATSAAFEDSMATWADEARPVAIGATRDTPVQYLVDALARLHLAGVSTVRVFESVAL